MRMEMESRDSGEQLREMAEKVFQLLERLKLAELAKNKAMEVRLSERLDETLLCGAAATIQASRAQASSDQYRFGHLCCQLGALYLGVRA